MSDYHDMTALKKRLLQYCQEVIECRIMTARKAMDSAQAAANAEEKSSAGDKYETARAMGHLEKDMYARQVTEHAKELSNFQALKTDAVHDVVVPGALIQCDNVYFFLCAGLGKQIVDGHSILFISPYAPLARTVLHKKRGDQFSFKGEMLTITSIA